MRGLLLVIIIALGIYLAFTAFQTKKVVKSTQEGISRVTQAQITALKSDLNTYAAEIAARYTTTGEFPETLREVFGRTPQDPWGHPLVYRKYEDGFELRSVGPDGIENTSDDIVVRR